MARPNNLAYDFSVYEPVVKQEPRERIQVRKNNAVQSVSAIKSLITAIAAFFLLCAILYGKVEISQTFNEKTQLQNSLSVINDENIRLQTELDSKSALSDIEDYAVNTLGLQKLDEGQMEYVQLQQENVIEVVENKDGNVFVSMKNWFSEVLEYIGA